MLTVRDIMQTDVVTVTADATARCLARLLADGQISGVPVLDGNGELAGVVSSTDLVRFAADGSGVPPDPYGYFLTEDLPFDGRRFVDELPESDFDTVTVDEIMTPVSFSVEPATPLPELCEFLVRGRIHRAVVVEDAQLVGIVTTVDVLRAVGEHGVAA